MQHTYMQHTIPARYIPSDLRGEQEVSGRKLYAIHYTDHRCTMDAIRKRAKKLGADQLEISTRAAKKYMVRYRGRWIHFGARNYSDFTQHRDPLRRDNYRARHSKILLADGRPAYKVPEQPAYWAWHIL